MAAPKAQNGYGKRAPLQGLGSRAAWDPLYLGLYLLVQGSRVQGLGFRVWGLGFRV